MGSGDEEPERRSDGEVVEFGSPGGGRGTRWWWLLAVGVVVAAVIVVVTVRQQTSGHQTSGPAQPGDDPSATAPATSPAATTPGSPPQRSVPVSSSAPRTGSKSPSDGSGAGTFQVSDLHLPEGTTMFVVGAHAIARVRSGQDAVQVTKTRRVSARQPARVIVADHEVLVAQGDGGGYVVPDGKPAHRLLNKISSAIRVLPGPHSDTVWALEPSRRRLPQPTLRLRGLDGHAIGDPIQLPRTLIGFSAQPDQRGGVLMRGINGVYDVTLDGVQRVTTGAVLAVGVNTLLLVECDEQAHCKDVVVDRKSGQRHELSLDRRLARRGLVGMRYGAVSPDGRLAALFSYLRGPRLKVIDLHSGHITSRAFSAAEVNSSTDGLVTWSPDSTWVYTVFNGKLYVTNARTGSTHRVDLPLKGVRAVAFRQ